MFLPEISLPAAVVGTVIAIGGVAYLLAPEIGKRLVHNSGVIAACERGIESRSGRESQRTVELPGGVRIDPRKALESFFRPFGRDGQSFLDHHGPQLREWGRQANDLLSGLAGADSETNEQRQARAAESACACRARIAISKGHSALALFTATGGLVAWSPVGEWRVAMAAPDVVAQCKEVS